jgi:hypothetical protein
MRIKLSPGRGDTSFLFPKFLYFAKFNNEGTGFRRIIVVMGMEDEGSAEFLD